MRKRAERELQNLKEFNEGVIDSIAEVLLVIDPKDYRILAANGEAEKELKLRKEDLVGKTCYEVTHNCSVPCEDPHRCPLQEALATGKVTSANHVHFDKDQNKMDVEISVYPYRNMQGEITRVIHLARNVTEHKKAEDELKIAANIFDLATDSIMVIDMDGKIVNFNQAAYKLYGYTKDEMAEMNIRDIDTPQTASQIESRIKLLLEKGSAVFETVQVCKDKTLLPTEIHARIIDLKGKKLILSVIRDISERKKAETALRASEEKHRKLFEGSADAIFLADAETGILIDCNPAALELVGREKSEIVGQQQSILHPQHEIEGDYARVFKQHLKQDSVLESQVIAKTGEIKDVTIKSNRIVVGGRTVLQGVFRDTTERKKVEKKLQISEERVRQAQKVAHIGDWDWNVKTGVLVWGEETYKLFGFPLEMVPSVDKFLAMVYPADVAFVRQSIEDALKGKAYNIDMRIIRTDGALRVANATGEVEFDVQGKPVRMFGMIQDITEREGVEDELKMAAHIFDLATDSIFVHDIEGNIVNFNEAAYRLRGYSKDEMAKMNIQDLDVPESATLVESRIKTLIESGSAVFESLQVCKDKTLLPVEIHARLVDLEGKKLILAIARDISERMKAEEELNLMMDQLVLVNEKLGVVGSLTRHDVRNKLSAVTGQAYLLKKKHADQADIVDGLSKIEQSVKEAVKIFEFSKMYEQIGAEKLVYVNVEEKLNEAVVIFSGSLPKIINDCHGLSLLADSFVRQLFYNLIDNTRKYGEKSATIRVYFEKAESDGLRLIYEDDGVGISVENKSKLFNEGYSTGGSTGFGLFLIKKMIEVYGWRITEEGNQGKGAKFLITIPKINQKGTENYRISQDNIWGKSQIIL